MNELFNDISSIAHKVFAKGWSEANAGNFSVLLPKLPGILQQGAPINLAVSLPTPIDLLISASGSKMEEIRNNPEKNCVFVNGEKSKLKVFNYEGGLTNPSSEYLTHLLIHAGQVKAGASTSAVLHVHPLEVIAITHIRPYCSQQKINELIWAMQPESVVLLPEGIGFVPYLLTGSPELANVTAEKCKNHEIVIWEKHGILARAANLSAAFDLIEVVVKSLKIFFLCRQAGFDPEGLSFRQIKELKEKFGRKR